MKQGCTYAININICMARGDNECPWVDIVQSSNPCVNVKVVSGCCTAGEKRQTREPGGPTAGVQSAYMLASHIDSLF